MDDDGDGAVDEGNENDDDEDGQQDEDPLNEVVYLYDSGTSTLTESVPSTGESDRPLNPCHSFPNQIYITRVNRN